MKNKSHLIYTTRPKEAVTFKMRKGGGKDSKKEKREIKDYEPQAKRLKKAIGKFTRDRNDRNENRTVFDAYHFDLIEIDFFGYFDQPKYEHRYLEKFGLSIIILKNFNRTGLFLIEDEDKFKNFLKQIKKFGKKYIGKEDHVNFDKTIIYINNFRFYSSQDRIGNTSTYSIVNLRLIELNKSNKDISYQFESLLGLLEENKIKYEFDPHNSMMDIFLINKKLLDLILDNYDFVLASCSSTANIIRPDLYGTPQRGYNFTVSVDDSKPIIGIIDTGISSLSPLKDITIYDSEFDLTGTNIDTDMADHGTGVATFAALGDEGLPNYTGDFIADAQLLPIKVLNGKKGSISQIEIFNSIRKAVEKYGVKIFVLTIGYGQFPLKDNEPSSGYAYLLDKLAHELDILIFISASNNPEAVNAKYPDSFFLSESNIAPPAESLNNITIGAQASNFEPLRPQAISSDPDFPSIFSRNNHLNFEDESIFNSKTKNKHLRKPDLLMPGGDFELGKDIVGTFVEECGQSALSVVSADMKYCLMRRSGTSYSAPLCANLAAKLLNIYPNLDADSIKALLINSANFIDMSKSPACAHISKLKQLRLQGYGIPSTFNTLYSNDNSVSFLIRDNIKIGDIIYFPLKTPDYLNQAKRKNALLKVNATLCFSFEPNISNQLTYCPIHMGFIIAKDIEFSAFEEKASIDKNGNERTIFDPIGINGNSSDNIGINSNDKWSQDFYYKNKITSNVQKVSFNISRQQLIDENNSFKIAINSEYQKLFTDREKEFYDKEVEFSLIINLEQCPLKDETLDSLYDELENINEMSAILSDDITLEN